MAIWLFPSVGTRSFPPWVGVSRRKLKPMTDKLVPPPVGGVAGPTAAAPLPVSRWAKLLIGSAR